MTAALAARWPLQVDVVRFLAVGALLALLSGVSYVLQVPSVPMFYVDLLILAPFLHTRIGATLIMITILVALARLVQALFGFDQLFLSIYLLARNLSGFPVEYVVGLIGAVTVTLGALVWIERAMPRRLWRIHSLVAVAAIATVLGMKRLEEATKTNIVGTSYGYLIGAVRFSEMLYGDYEIPLRQAAPSPALQGAETALATHSSYLLVLVESLGVPSSEASRTALMAPFGDAELARKYDVVVGAVPAAGSTIHGEIRELCNGELKTGLFGTGNVDCLPGRFRERGYRTTAVHANRAGVYGRNTWYPSIGFDTFINADSEGFPRHELEGRWGTLPDDEAIDWTVARHFRSAPEFLYLLLVSTHVPAKPLPGVAPDPDCLASGTAAGCAHLANLHHVLGRVAERARDLDNTTLVVVGDHAPPFVNPASRRMFQKELVPFVILRPRRS